MRPLIRLAGSLVLSMALSVSALAAEMVLLPISVRNVPGAGGSVWFTDERVFVTGDANAIISPLSRSGNFFIPDHEHSLRIFGGTPERPYYVLFVHEVPAENVTISVRVRDISRDSVGTDIPVVWEDEFRDGRIILLDVPYRPQEWRAALRVYGIGGERTFTSATIRYFESFTNTELAVGTLDLTGMGHPLNPIVFGQIHGLPDLQLSDPDNSLRIEISVDDPSLPIWAFVSLTCADSEVQLVTP